jgi:hypothetical protein
VLDYFVVQWESKYRTSGIQKYLKTELLLVWLSNGLAICKPDETVQVLNDSNFNLKAIQNLKTSLCSPQSPTHLPKHLNTRIVRYIFKLAILCSKVEWSSY